MHQEKRMLEIVCQNTKLEHFTFAEETKFDAKFKKIDGIFLLNEKFFFNPVSKLKDNVLYLWKSSLQTIPTF